MRRTRAPPLRLRLRLSQHTTHAHVSRCLLSDWTLSSSLGVIIASLSLLLHQGIAEKRDPKKRREKTHTAISSHTDRHKAEEPPWLWACLLRSRHACTHAAPTQIKPRTQYHIKSTRLSLPFFSPPLLRREARRRDAKEPTPVPPAAFLYPLSMLHQTSR